MWSLGKTGTTKWCIVGNGSAVDLCVLGAEFDDNETAVEVAGGARWHALGSVVAPYEPAPPYVLQNWYPDTIDNTTMAVMLRGFDALRRLDSLDLKINFPWTNF